MASLTVARPDLFPNGTSIGAYNKQSPKFGHGSEGKDAPSGTAAATASMSSGTATLTGLTDGTKYDVVGLVGSEWRRIQMSTPEVGTGVTGLQASGATNPNGTARPAWRVRRRALGLV